MLSLQHHQDLQTEWELQSESCFHVETVRNSSGRKHYWEERTRMSAAVGGSESTSSSRLLERRAPWEEASYSGRFSISHQRSDPRPPGPHPSPSLWTVCTQTWADDPRVLLMSAVVLLPALGRARPHVRLISSAVQVVQPDGSWSRPKVSRPRGIEGFSTAQLPAHHAGIVQVPAVITDGAPGALVKDLHSPGAGTAPVHQAELSAVWGGRNGTMGVLTGEWEGSSVLWDLHLSSRGRSPLKLQSLLVQRGSRCTGAAPGSGFLQK